MRPYLPLGVRLLLPLLLRGEPEGSGRHHGHPVYWWVWSPEPTLASPRPRASPAHAAQGDGQAPHTDRSPAEHCLGFPECPSHGRPLAPSEPVAPETHLGAVLSPQPATAPGTPLRLEPSPSDAGSAPFHSSQVSPWTVHAGPWTLGCALTTSLTRLLMLPATRHPPDGTSSRKHPRLLQLDGASLPGSWAQTEWPRHSTRGRLCFSATCAGHGVRSFWPAGVGLPGSVAMGTHPSR